MHGLVDQLVSLDSQNRVIENRLPYKIVHSVGNLLIRLAGTEQQKIQVEGLPGNLIDAFLSVARGRKSELSDYALKRASGSNLNYFDWQIRVHFFRM